jgi:hypothetical protein
MNAKKPFFGSHAKSSAAVATVAVHAALIVLAFFFVAVTVINKDEVDFQAKPVSRPKMNLRKLQVPVNIKKPVQQPKLRKQIVATPKLNKVMPDFKMPEIIGVKGGLGSAGSGGIGGASLGFAMPEIDVFGLKSRGEKIFFILDSSTEMMEDEIGGIRAYTIIKNELANIINSLPSTTLFNVCVYDHGHTCLLFSQMVTANPVNVGKVDAWLKPLNAVKPGMGANEYGVFTLGKGGIENTEDFRSGRFKQQELWYRPTMLAMKQQADTVFVLTTWWGDQRIKLDESRQKQCNPWDMNMAYCPEIEFPPDAEWYFGEPGEFAEAMVITREKYAPKSTMLGLSKKKNGKYGFSFNVVRFAKRDRDKWTEYEDGRTETNFKKLVSILGGNYGTIAGLEAIENLVNGT